MLLASGGQSGLLGLWLLFLLLVDRRAAGGAHTRHLPRLEAARTLGHWSCAPASITAHHCSHGSAARLARRLLKGTVAGMARAGKRRRLLHGAVAASTMEGSGCRWHDSKTSRVHQSCTLTSVGPHMELEVFGIDWSPIPLVAFSNPLAMRHASSLGRWRSHL